jgi:outer membrane protein
MHPPLRALRRPICSLAAGLCAVLAGCVHAPAVDGVAGVAPTPEVPWTPPPRMADTARAAPEPAIPPGLAERVRSLTLTDIIDVALRNNPTTRIAWANARAAAAAYGSRKGQYYPTIDGDVSATRLKTVASSGRSAVQQTVYNPSVSISWLLLDFGGRSGSIDAARQALLAADWTHNATIQNVVLGVESAYFDYMATKSLLTAQQTTLQEARTSLAAAEERHRVGLATIADVLQARTAVSQAELDVETTEGTLQTTRGSLAVSMGLPANLPYDVEPPDTTSPVGRVSESVDSLIAKAVLARPDLAAAEAQYQQARAGITSARAERLPSLSLSGSAGQTYLNPNRGGGSSYTLSLGLRIPLFAGFSRAYDEMQARATADAAAARLDALRQQVIFQVFSSYHTLLTATRRVRTADDLLASATESEQVALGRYKAGVGSVLDLLSAQSALASARAQQVQARWIWRTALAQLAHDAGVLDVHGGSPIPLAPATHDTIPPR